MKRIKERYYHKLLEFKEQKNSIRRLWNIEEKTAEFLYFTILIKKPSKILEIGTSNGYSTFWLSLAAEKINSKVQTIEVDEKRFQMAKKNLNERTNIEMLFGKAEEIIPKLSDEIDFVFIDAGKIGYINYLQKLLPKLANNALILADNVTSHQKTVTEYLKTVKNNQMFQSMTLPIEDGIEITIFEKGELK